VVVFPDGEYDANRSTLLSANKFDFAGRTGYVRAAIEATVAVLRANRR
jgi:hypothetical protein